MTENKIGTIIVMQLLRCIENWDLGCSNRFTRLCWPMNYNNAVST